MRALRREQQKAVGGLPLGRTVYVYPVDGALIPRRWFRDIKKARDLIWLVRQSVHGVVHCSQVRSPEPVHAVGHEARLDIERSGKVR